VDGAGLCSPGRWPVAQRVLPDDYTSKLLRKTLVDGLVSAMKAMRKADPTMDIKKLLLSLALGKFKGSPFDTTIVEEVRADLRIFCKQGAHGDGLPREGDVCQHFEVRLIQAMLSAFQDPDHYFCQWWATGTWLGSTSRKLPRTPRGFRSETEVEADRARRRPAPGMAVQLPVPGGARRPGTGAARGREARGHDG